MIDVAQVLVGGLQFAFAVANDAEQELALQVAGDRRQDPVELLPCLLPVLFLKLDDTAQVGGHRHVLLDLVDLRQFLARLVDILQPDQGRGSTQAGHQTLRFRGKNAVEQGQGRLVLALHAIVLGPHQQGLGVVREVASGTRRWP